MLMAFHMHYLPLFCRWHATWNLDDLVLGAGWEKGGSASWSPEMHAIAETRSWLERNCIQRNQQLIKQTVASCCCITHPVWNSKTSQDGDTSGLKSMDFTVSLPALSLAARSGRTEILELLLQRSSVDLEKDAPSIAIAAARSGHISVLSHLRNKGITSSWLSYIVGCWTSFVFEGVDILQISCRNPQRFFSSSFSPGLLHASRVSGSSALHEASRCGRLEVLRWLLAVNADCRQMDANGSEALQARVDKSPWLGGGTSQKFKYFKYLGSYGWDLHVEPKKQPRSNQEGTSVRCKRSDAGGSGIWSRYCCGSVVETPSPSWCPKFQRPFSIDVISQKWTFRGHAAFMQLRLRRESSRCQRTHSSSPCSDARTSTSCCLFAGSFCSCGFCGCFWTDCIAFVNPWFNCDSKAHPDHLCAFGMSKWYTDVHRKIWFLLLCSVQSHKITTSSWNMEHNMTSRNLRNVMLLQKRSNSRRMLICQLRGFCSMHRLMSIYRMTWASLL